MAVFLESQEEKGCLSYPRRFLTRNQVSQVTGLCLFIDPSYCCLICLICLPYCSLVCPVCQPYYLLICLCQFVSGVLFSCLMFCVSCLEKWVKLYLPATQSLTWYKFIANTFREKYAALGELHPELLEDKDLHNETGARYLGSVGNLETHSLWQGSRQLFLCYRTLEIEFCATSLI